MAYIKNIKLYKPIHNSVFINNKKKTFKNIILKTELLPSYLLAIMGDLSELAYINNGCSFLAYFKKSKI